MQTVLQEVEAKFIVRRPAQVDDVLRTLDTLGYTIELDREITHTDTYFDTRDLSIFRAGWALRCRETDNANTLMLKSVNSGAHTVFVRKEVKQPIADGTDPAARKLPAGPVADLLGKTGAGSKRTRLFTIRTQRTVYRVASGGPQITRLEMDLDHSVIEPINARRSAPGRLVFTELELELDAGDVAGLEGLARHLVDEARLIPARSSKFERGLWAAGLDPEQAGKPGKRRRFNGKDAFADLLYWYLGKRRQSLSRHRPIACEGIHPEGVHKMRVAIRRTRAMLTAFDDILPRKVAKSLDRDLKWIAGQLGAARDADVCAMAISDIHAALPTGSEAAIAPYVDYLRQGTLDAYNDLAVVLCGRRYLATMDSLDRFVSAGATRDPELTIAKASQRYVRPAISKTLRRGDRIGRRSTSRELHKLRIRTKRLRYLLDLFSKGQPRKWQATISALEKLQDLLGEHQDACTARQRLDAFAASLPARKSTRALWLSTGRLMQREDDRIAACRRRFPAAWSRFRKAVG